MGYLNIDKISGQVMPLSGLSEVSAAAKPKGSIFSAQNHTPAANVSKPDYPPSREIFYESPEYYDVFYFSYNGKISARVSSECLDNGEYVKIKSEYDANGNLKRELIYDLDEPDSSLVVVEIHYFERDGIMYETIVDPFHNEFPSTFELDEEEAEEVRNSYQIAEEELEMLREQKENCPDCFSNPGWLWESTYQGFQY